MDDIYKTALEFKFSSGKTLTFQRYDDGDVEIDVDSTYEQVTTYLNLEQVKKVYAFLGEHIQKQGDKQ